MNGMTAMAKETIVAAVEKMGIMESGESVHAAAAIATENSILSVAVAVAV